MYIHTYTHMLLNVVYLDVAYCALYNLHNAYTHKYILSNALYLDTTSCLTCTVPEAQDSNIHTYTHTYVHTNAYERTCMHACMHAYS